MEQEKEGKSEDDEIDDPFLPCYRCGCNLTTCNETLGLLNLWFHTVPMLTISVLYALTQLTCKAPDRRDVSPMVRNVAISMTAACVSTLWKSLISFVRVYKSTGSRIREQEDCSKWCTSYSCFRDCVLKTIPKKGDVLFPSDMRAQYCIIPFVLLQFLQLSATIYAIGATLNMWSQYASLIRTADIDDSLSIYRPYFQDNVDTNKVKHLLDVADIIIPPPTYLYLEDISKSV